MSRGKKIAKENINTEQAAVTNQELLCAIKTVSRYLCGNTPHCVRCAMISHCGSHYRVNGIFQNWRNCGMDKDTLQKAKELERDVKVLRGFWKNMINIIGYKLFLQKLMMDSQSDSRMILQNG